MADWDGEGERIKGIVDVRQVDYVVVDDDDDDDDDDKSKLADRSVCVCVCVCLYTNEN